MGDMVTVWQSAHIIGNTVDRRHHYGRRWGMVSGHNCFRPVLINS